VLKVDFGVHVKGTIVDSAFTMNFEPTWDRLLEAVKDATNTGVRVCPCPSCTGKSTADE
jgi:methionyl aminopeptidase